MPALVLRDVLWATLAPAALAQTQRDWSGKEPIRYSDPDVVPLDKQFDKYKINNTPIERVWTGALWAEGPAWSGQGRYLVWSDIPNNRQMRWMEEDGHVSTFRVPSDYSNGNTFDYEGRQVCCQHALRRVCRFEPDGTVTTIADKFNGKPLNSPNDIVVHPDGAIWFTDPPYGILGNYEGFQAKQELKEAVYRVDPKTAKIEKVTDELDKPNGICFSPDYKKVYICDTGDAPGHPGLRPRRWQDPPQQTAVHQHEYSRHRQRHRPTAYARTWTAISGPAPGGWARATTESTSSRPKASASAMILLPEICANLCFGGSKRNRLFMAASQSIYAVYVGTRGAHIT